VVELGLLFGASGLACRFFGHLRVDAISFRQRLFRPLKKAASAMGLIPKTMAGKKFLKRLVFGGLVPMPAEIGPETTSYAPPVALPPEQPDRRYKVIYAAAAKPVETETRGAYA
jgi:hypothetical protein